MENEIISALTKTVEKLIESQEIEKSWTDTWLTPLTALTGIFITSLLSYHFGFRKQLQIAELRARQELFGALMGYKFSISQLYVSRFEAIIISDFHEQRWKLTGTNENSIDLQEAKRWMKKSENLALDISEKNELLFRTIGSIKATFPESTELEKLTSRIYNFKTPQTYPAPDNLKMEGLDSWKETAVSRLQKIVNNEISLPIDMLLKHLDIYGKLKTPTKGWRWFRS